MPEKQISDTKHASFDQLVSVSDLTALSRRDRKWVERRIVEVPRHSEGKSPKYRLAAVVAAFCQDEPPDEAGLKEIADRQREQAAEADRKEMRAAREARAIVELVSAASALKDWAVRFNTFLASMPLTANQREQILSHARNSIESVAAQLAADEP